MSNRKHAEVIDMLKTWYRESYDPWVSTMHIRAWLNSEGIKASYKQVLDWDRKARLQLADEGISITNPVKANGYSRQGTPTLDERLIARAPRIKDTNTRLRNDLREATADAAQADASTFETLKAKMLKHAVETHDMITDLNP